MKAVTALCLIVDKLTAFELFKVYDEQIHKVEAFIRLLSPELELGGWPVTVSQP